MKSFGIWYSSSDIQEHYPVEHSSPVSAEKEPELDLHINLWDISGKRAKSAAPFIDIGMNISEFRKIDKLCFLITFGVESSGIVDLTDTFEKKSIANLVFNDDCRFTRNENGFCVLELMEHEGKKKLLYNMAEAEVKTVCAMSFMICILDFVFFRIELRRSFSVILKVKTGFLRVALPALRSLTSK